MRHKCICFRDASGTQDIHAQLWLPDSAPRAIVQVVHGINEHGGRYASFAQYLAVFNIGLAVHDQMGHGDTAAACGRFGYFAPQDGWKNLLQDILFFRRQLVSKFPGLPIFLFGHSMGSFAVRCLLIDDDTAYDGVILSGTGSNPRWLYDFGLFVCLLARLRHGKEGKSKLLQLLCFGRFARLFAAEAHPMAWLSRVEQVYRDYAKDPYCRFLPSISMYREMFRAMRYMDQPAGYAKVRRDIPLLLVSGDQDPVGGMGKGISRVYRRYCDAGLQDVELLLYPGGRHEMLHEQNRDEVFGDILEWLCARIDRAALPA